MIKKRLKSLSWKLYPQHNFFSPRWVVLGVNNICNLHCKMCDVGTENFNTTFAQNLVGSQPLNMPLVLVKKIIEQTATFFPTAKIGYAFTEPLIYPHLVESLQYANDFGLYTTVTTNALTLRQKAKDLVDAGLNEVFISLDGTEQIHNEIRGNKKSFERAVQGIEALASYSNRPKISIVYAITEWNIDCMLDFLDYFRGNQVDEIAFMHTQYTDEQVAVTHNEKYGNIYQATISNIQELNFDNMDLTKLLMTVNYIKNASYPFTVFFSPNITSKEELDIYYYHPEKILGSHCSDVFSNIMIKSDGSVIPSHGRCYNLTVGNVYQDTLKNIWNSNTFGKLRSDIMEAGGYFDACSRCCSGFNSYESKKQNIIL